jgi:hypothetical protein
LFPDSPLRVFFIAFLLIKEGKPWESKEMEF